MGAAQAPRAIIPPTHTPAASTWAGGGRTPVARVRRLVAVAMAACAAFIGLSLTPHINELHRRGVPRGVGPEGAELESIHRTAEKVGKAETGLGVLLVVLHVFTIPTRRRDDDDYTAPLPPGES